MKHEVRDVIPYEVTGKLASTGVRVIVRRREVSVPWLTKSLSIRSRRDSTVVIAICARDEKIDLRAVARLMGWHRARLASPLEVLAFLGQDQPAISPVLDDGAPVLIDAALTGFGRVLVNAGTHDLYVEVSVPDLSRMTHGMCAPLTLPRCAGNSGDDILRVLRVWQTRALIELEQPWMAPAGSIRSGTTVSMPVACC